MGFSYVRYLTSRGKDITSSSGQCAQIVRFSNAGVDSVHRSLSGRIHLDLHQCDLSIQCLCSAPHQMISAKKQAAGTSTLTFELPSIYTIIGMYVICSVWSQTIWVSVITICRIPAKFHLFLGGHGAPVSSSLNVLLRKRMYRRGRNKPTKRCVESSDMLPKPRVGLLSELGLLMYRHDAVMTPTLSPLCAKSVHWPASER